MRPVRLAVSVLALTVGTAARAQIIYPQGSPYATVPAPYPVQPLSDADVLAREIRLLAADPQNLPALVRAGELALKLDDDTAAAAFFARAERIDPRNARVKAGEGSLLVSAERPGDALRHFQEAEALGGDPRTFAADRGLAFDLIGEQDRAQRDYRLALRAGSNDETQRRYALSLGISGKRELALKQIDPLLRKSDRGAWRARAFILAMGGDKSGAERIATSMMPIGMAQGLQPFFEILPNLRPADRAFAVHFGEVRATPERMSDARMVPAFAALPPDPTAPVEAVTVKQVVAVVDPREARRNARKSRKDRRQIAALTTPPPQPLPAPPAYSGQPVTTGAATASSVRVAPTTVPVTVAPATAASIPRIPPVSVAALPDRRPLIVPSAPTAQRTAPVVTVPPVVTPVVTVPPVVVAASKAVVAQTTVVPRPIVVSPAVPQTQNVATTIPRPALNPVGSVVATPLYARPQVATATPIVVPTSPAVSVPPVLPSGAAAVPSPSVSAPPPEANTIVTATVPTSVPMAAANPPPVPLTPTPVRSEESILAAIIADIKVPGAELEAAPPVATENKRSAERSVSDQAALERKADEMHALADAKALIDKKTADKKAAADKKVLADKKAAAEKKLAEKKAAEEKRKNDPKILEPSRIWVQVAGGANAETLPKEWSKVRAKSKGFGSKGGWTTPLRATNRILTGPFKSEDDAQDFVNTVRKDGVSGFVFVSEAGQKITKLGGK